MPTEPSQEEQEETLPTGTEDRLLDSEDDSNDSVSGDDPLDDYEDLNNFINSGITTAEVRYIL